MPTLWGGGAIPALAKTAANFYVRCMFKFCLPTKATIVSDGSDWLHEVKYDGYPSA